MAPVGARYWPVVTTVILALCSALAYGFSDFAAGITARRVSVWSVAICTQAASLLIIAAALVQPALRGAPDLSDVAWGLLAAVGNAMGTAFIYRGFATGRMSVVAPISAVGAAVVPVATGVLLGERPSVLVWAGIVAALPGIWFVSRVADTSREGTITPSGHAAAVRDAVIAGFGFGVLFVGLGQIPREAGLQPVVLSQLIALGLLIGAATLVRARWRPSRRAVAGGAVAGVLSGAANLTYLWATHSGPMTVAAILTTLYPAVTILLAAAVLGERIDRVQALGLLLCATAVTFVAAG
ncbi:hypothetical protein KILIM_020_00030 [Kineosphaera limosa NBRC 100340]|uniref:EamA domain-containing protein n=1 Tax=Kineosphaera limosa NBRC 100340 TaxID=1184609 RepID=K6W8B3_9MICO|nr:hypothetical protein KILIM_020_00030 [Kineosphaera limosa NBRC 100340]